MEDEAKKSAEPPSPDTESCPATENHSSDAVQSLKRAMRRARSDDAERTGVMAELRAARIGRLELLQEALVPIVAQIPKEVDLFDVGLMPGVNPRLFIDMIGFVEMGREARVFRFVQDTRHGRITIAESEDPDTMVEAVTDYMARRLLERDKALAADTFPAPRRKRDPGAQTRSRDEERERTADDPPPRGASGRQPFGSPVYWSGIVFSFVIDLLGSIAFFMILAGIGWVVWNRLHGQSG